MSAAAPWSVKGIDPKARETAKDLARRANMTLGEWLNRVILEDETQAGSAGSSQADESQAKPDDEVGRVASALDVLSAKITASEKQAAERPVAPGHAERELMSVAARFENAVQDLSGEHARLSERLRRLEAESSGPRSAAALQSLERALGKMTERLYSGENRLDDRLAAMEERLARVEDADPAIALRDLSTSMTALDMRLKSLESGPDPRLETRLSSLEVRVSEGFDAAHSQFEAGLSELDARASNALQHMGAQVVGVAQSLAGRLDGVEQRTLQATEQVGGDIAHLATSMEQRLGHVDQIQAQALDKLGAEIARITERLSERIAAAEKRNATAMDDVGQHMARVTERLTQQQDRSTSDLADRIRASEERTASLIEQTRSTFEKSLERARAAMIPLAMAAGSAKVERPAAKPAGAALAAAANWTLPSPFGHREAFFVDEETSFSKTPAEAPHVASAEEDEEIALEPLNEPIFEPEDEVLAAEPEILADDVAPQPEADEEPAFAEEPVFADEAALFAEPEEDVFAEADGLVGGDEGLDAHFADAESVAAEIEDPAADEPIWRSVEAFEDEAFVPADEVAAAAAAVETDAAREDDEPSAEHDAALLDARPLSTREVIEQARAAARASAEATAKRGNSLFSSLGNKFGKSQPRAKLFGSAAFWVIALVGGGGIGMTATALWLMDHPAKSSAVETASTEVPAQAAVALTDATQSDLRTATETATAANGVDLARLYSDAAKRIEAHDNGGLTAMRQAANLGYAPAQFYLSKLYEGGQAGLKKDPTTARLWTQRAADNGEPKAMYNLALDYYQGVGGAKDYGQAATWFTKSANAGLSDGQFNLALLYERGVGVPQNSAEAYKWYMIAAQNGDAASRAEAQGAAERVKGQLSGDAAGIAERAAAAFRPTTASTAVAAATSSDIAQAQRALNKLGYYNGPQDGVASTTLASAVTAYQQDNGLPATGRLDATVENRLQVFNQ